MILRDVEPWSPWKGLRELMISYRTTPMLQMSVRTSTGRPCNCSGDM